MSISKSIPRMTEDEKKKVAYALNLCAVSVSQIIDSGDIVVLKQERDNILNNINLQNFVKHEALLDVLKRILDTITYLEIQAGDRKIINEKYRKQMKDAIWQAIPNPGVLFAGDALSAAITLAVQVGTGYMNYRRNKSQYELDKMEQDWKLMKHEIEQLQGLRAQLFETAWRLSDDYDFNDIYRLTETQLTRLSSALLEEDHLKRYEKLDVMSYDFGAFPPFWYYIGNAAMNVYHNKDMKYGDFCVSFKEKAIEAYKEFQKIHFKFLREDIIAASCCMEYISLLDINESRNKSVVKNLLDDALRIAGDNYDILQQSVLVNMKLKQTDKIILALRKMIAFDYNVEVNGYILSRIYLEEKKYNEYTMLCDIAGKDRVLRWNEDPAKAEEEFHDKKRLEMLNEYRVMSKRISSVLSSGSSYEHEKNIYDKYVRLSDSIMDCCTNKDQLCEHFSEAKNLLTRALNETNKNKRDLQGFVAVINTIVTLIREDNCLPVNNEKVVEFIEEMKSIVKV